MYFSLAPNLLGIHTAFETAQCFAARHKFEGVDSSASQLAALSPAEVEAARERFATLNLRAGYFSLDPVVVSAKESDWEAGVERLKIAAPVAGVLGYTRAIAVVLPFSETLAFAEDFGFHVARLKRIAPILEANHISLGLELRFTARAPRALSTSFRA